MAVSVARASFLRISPRKMRLVADMIRGMDVDSARAILKSSPKKASRYLLKILQSGVANAEQKGDVDLRNLYIKELLVDSGPTLPRFMPRAMGRATRIRRRTCKVKMVLDER